MSSLVFPLDSIHDISEQIRISVLVWTLKYYSDGLCFCFEEFFNNTIVLANMQSVSRYEVTNMFCKTI